MNKKIKIYTLCIIGLMALSLVALAVSAVSGSDTFKPVLDSIGFYSVTIASILALVIAIQIFSCKEKPESAALGAQEIEELAQYRDAFKSLYHYVGSYPSWKALQEYRELVLSLKSDANHCEYHFYNVDAYLNKVVREIDNLRKYHDAQYSQGHGWNPDTLPQAKGDYLLQQIAARHSNFIDFKRKTNEKHINQ